MTKLRNTVGIILCVLLIGINYSNPVQKLRKLPRDIWINPTELDVLIDSFGYPLSADFEGTLPTFISDAQPLGTQAMPSNRGAGADIGMVDVKLFGVISVGKISVKRRELGNIVPGGHNIGIALKTKGPLVVGIGEIETATGERISPASKGGLRPGDTITTIDGKAIQNADELSNACDTSDEIDVVFIRDEKEQKTRVLPAMDGHDEKYKLGVWVRESTMGVGTLSCFVEQNGWYGALGHAIIDLDTGTRLSVQNGSVVRSSIVDIVRGEKGRPGELRGSFNDQSPKYGNIEKNTEFGIYGKAESPITNPLYPGGVPLAHPDEAREGSASILTTLDKEGIKAYECQIIRVNKQTEPAAKGMVIKVTDPRLLAATGGIIQGMSGSPIIQNNKLLGVVTHVFINDPTKGYCMYALWMVEMTE